MRISQLPLVPWPSPDPDFDYADWQLTGSEAYAVNVDRNTGAPLIHHADCYHIAGTNCPTVSRWEVEEAWLFAAALQRHGIVQVGFCQHCSITRVAARAAS